MLVQVDLIQSFLYHVSVRVISWQADAKKSGFEINVAV